MQQPKIYAWDLETSDLNANWGYIFCGVVIDVFSGERWVFKASDYPAWHRHENWNDKGLVRDLSEKLREADLWLTHYGSLKKFDLPYLNTRLVHHRLPVMPVIPMVDTHTVARGQLKLHSNRLQSLLDLLGKKSKTPLQGSIWTKAKCGHTPSLNYVVKHCIRDVEALVEVYFDLRPLIRNHPHLSAITGNKEGCPNCNEVGTLQKRGWHHTRTYKQRQYWCRACRTWPVGRERIKVETDMK